jgi:hypothetical protein
MNDWITNRKPTAKDGNSNEDVWVSYANGDVFSAKWWSAAAQDHCVAWKRKEQTPEPYVPRTIYDTRPERQKLVQELIDASKDCLELLEDWFPSMDDMRCASETDSKKIDRLKAAREALK